MSSIKSRSAHGLTRTLINNMVVGVTKGFETALEINGVGYRAEVKGDVLNLSLGYSHPINFDLPKGITVEVEKMTKVMVIGIDKELVGQYRRQNPSLPWRPSPTRARVSSTPAKRFSEKPAKPVKNKQKLRRSH